jgi:hypothetical protein
MPEKDKVTGEVKELIRLYKLFDIARSFVFAESGDGWATIMTDKFVKVADLFEKFEKDNGNCFLTRIDNPNFNIITFYNGQESIRFTDKDYDSGDEFFVKINTYYL